MTNNTKFIKRAFP